MSGRAGAENRSGRRDGNSGNARNIEQVDNVTTLHIRPSAAPFAAVSLPGGDR
jgi:hypothetical protein